MGEYGSVLPLRREGNGMIYLIGSLRNPKVVEITKKLQDEGLDVFSDWYAAGEHADDAWRDYEKSRGRSYIEALSMPAAKNVFQFDLKHLSNADTVVLVAPAGKSGHMELGYALGQGKRGYYLLDDPERWDVMLQFCTGIFTDLDKLTVELKNERTEVGPILSGDGTICQHCLQRSVYENWCNSCWSEQ